MECMPGGGMLGACSTPSPSASKSEGSRSRRESACRGTSSIRNSPPT